MGKHDKSHRGSAAVPPERVGHQEGCPNNQAIRPSCLSTRFVQRRAHSAAACNAPPWSTAVCLAGKFFVVPIFSFVHHWTHHCRDTAVSWRAVGTSSPAFVVSTCRAHGTKPCCFLDPNSPVTMHFVNPTPAVRASVSIQQSVHTLPVVGDCQCTLCGAGNVQLCDKRARRERGMGRRVGKWCVGGGGVGRRP